MRVTTNRNISFGMELVKNDKSVRSPKISENQ